MKGVIHMRDEEWMNVQEGENQKPKKQKSFLRTLFIVACIIALVLAFGVLILETFWGVMPLINDTPPSVMPSPPVQTM